MLQTQLQLHTSRQSSGASVVLAEVLMASGLCVLDGFFLALHSYLTHATPVREYK